MFFKQFYLGCLAHASYLIGSNGEAVVIDPQRDIDQYLEEAATQHLTIKYVLETHLHADFVSGHRELAERTSAAIVFGGRADVLFPHLSVSDGDQLRVGQLALKILETPGHTPEGICVLVNDPTAPHLPAKLLTGDTLFIGDVGRPDLAGSTGFSAAEMAALLYESLHTKLISLPDEVEVYPAHGAGSMCGRNISQETSSTIGIQKRTNYALQPMTRDEFVAIMTTDLPEPPAYFFKDSELNRTGAAALSGAPRPPALSPHDLPDLIRSGAIVLDVRSPAAFGNGHIRGAFNIGLSGQFASWAGALLDMSTPLLIVSDDTDGVDECVMRLARVGIETVKGYLDGGMYAWDRAGLPTETISLIGADDLALRLNSDPDLRVVDLRREAEWKTGQIPGAYHAEPAHLLALTHNWSRDTPIAVICQSGYRSAIAASIMTRQGFTNILNVVGGMNAWTTFQTASSGATPVVPATPQHV